MEAVTILEAYRVTTVGIRCSSPCQQAVSHRVDFLKKSAQLEYTRLVFVQSFSAGLPLPRVLPGVRGLNVCVGGT